MTFKLEIKRFVDEEVIGTVKNIEEAREILDGLNGNGKKALEFWRMFKPVLESLRLFEEV